MIISPNELVKIIELVEAAKTDASHKVDQSTRLMEDAGIDSLGLMNLIEEVQRHCNVNFSPDDYSIERFHSVGAIFALVEQRKMENAAAQDKTNCNEKPKH